MQFWNHYEAIREAHREQQAWDEQQRRRPFSYDVAGPNLWTRFKTWLQHKPSTPPCPPVRVEIQHET